MARSGRSAWLGTGLLLGALLGLGGPSEGATALDCPEGTTSESEDHSGWRDAWCEKDGRRHGPFLSRWRAEDGVRKRGAYREGVRVGLWETFWPDGTKRGRAEFRMGEVSGIQTLWHPNGQVLASGRIVDGRPDGPHRRFYEDGTPKEVETFDSGVRQGPYRSWYSNGSPFQEGRYEGGSETGRWTTYHRTGEVAEVVRVDRGRVASVERSTDEKVLPSDAPRAIRMRPLARFIPVMDSVGETLQGDGS